MVFVSLFNHFLERRAVSKQPDELFTPSAASNFGFLRESTDEKCRRDVYDKRTRLVLAHKNIPHEVLNVDLKYKPSWFLDMAPYGLVPVIEYKGSIIYESMICDDFLEENFPEPKLLPTCSFERAKGRMLMHDYDKNMVANFYKLLSRDPEKREKGLSSLTRQLKRYDNLLERQKTKYFQGENCGMVDFHFWPWFERLPSVTQLTGIEILPPNSLHTLHRWIKDMENLEAVIKVKYPIEWYTEFMVSLAQKEPNYDIGLQAEAKL